VILTGLVDFADADLVYTTGAVTIEGVALLPNVHFAPIVLKKSFFAND
jgi:hypothetical protein